MIQKLRRLPAITWSLLLLTTSLAHGQSVCSSDNQAEPTALFERFTNADCDTCWRDANTPTGLPNALILDWIVPSDQGDEAPLAAAASTDALARLVSLQQTRPATQSQQTHSVEKTPGAMLRVAHGPAVGNYVGMSVSLSLPPETALTWPLSGWVVLAESLPSGTEGSPLSRNLIRNVLQPLWTKGDTLSNEEKMNFKEIRAMSLPEGTHPDRLQLLSWVQDARGRVLVAARSVCPPEDKTEPSNQTR